MWGTGPTPQGTTSCTTTSCTTLAQGTPQLYYYCSNAYQYNRGWRVKNCIVSEVSREHLPCSRWQRCLFCTWVMKHSDLSPKRALRPNLQQIPWASTSMKFGSYKTKPQKPNQDFRYYHFYPPAEFRPDLSGIANRTENTGVCQEYKMIPHIPLKLGTSAAGAWMQREAGRCCSMEERVRVCMIYCVSPCVSRHTQRSGGQQPASTEGDSLCRGPGRKPSKGSSLHGVLMEGTSNSKRRKQFPHPARSKFMATGSCSGLSY